MKQSEKPTAVVVVARVRERRDGILERSRELHSLAPLSDAPRVALELLDELDDILAEEDLPF